MKKHNQTAKVLLSVCMGISMIFIMNITLTAHSVFTSQVNSTLLDPAELNGETTTTSTNSTHIVLVHGSFGDGSVWSKVIPVLQNAGHRVTAVQLPLQSLTEDVAVVERAIERIGDPTILVGHSYGGAVITNAGYNNSNVTGLVYLAAYAPAQGESLLDLGNNTADLPENLFTIDNEGFMLMNPDLIHEWFAQDVNLTEVDIMAAIQKPVNLSTVEEKSGPPAWRQLPTWYQISENDRVVPPDLQHFFAESMNATILSLNASHFSQISQPDEIAGLILNATKGKY
ncbi:MAG: alpha/beta fold hydrolase [Nitrososphaeraceae archaeon]